MATEIATSERIFNLNPSPDTGTDWSMETALTAGLATAQVRPDAVDLREPWWTIGDQGITGSCVGWATADGVGRYLMVKAGRITQAQHLSPRYVWMASKERDFDRYRPTSFIEGAGTYLKAAMNVGRKYGFAKEGQLPFKVRSAMYTGDEDAFYASCATRRISYVNLRRNTEQWRDWLALGRPVLVGLLVDANWGSYSGGVLQEFDADTVYGGHAVCLVGYRKDGTFIVRNSWGTYWGADGFARVHPDYIRQAFYEESYGAVVS